MIDLSKCKDCKQVFGTYYVIGYLCGEPVHGNVLVEKYDKDDLICKLCMDKLEMSEVQNEKE